MKNLLHHLCLWVCLGTLSAGLYAAESPVPTKGDTVDVTIPRDDTVQGSIAAPDLDAELKRKTSLGDDGSVVTSGIRTGGPYPKPNPYPDSDPDPYSDPKPENSTINVKIPSNNNFKENFGTRKAGDELTINVSPDDDVEMKDGRVNGPDPIWKGFGNFTATGLIPDDLAGKHTGNFVGKFKKTVGSGGSGGTDGTETKIVDEWQDWKGAADVAALDLRLKEASFGGGNFDIFQDNGNGVYGNPAWYDADDNGDAKTPKTEKRFPVAYKRDTSPAMSTTFTIVPPAKLEPGDEVKIRGRGPDGIEFPEKLALIGKSTVTYPMTASTTRLPNTVRFYNTFNVAWEMYDGKKWKLIGTSDNRLYLVLNNPLGDQFETVYDVACRNADGKTIKSDVINAVWAEFQNTDPGVRRKKIDGYNNGDAKPMTYYGTWALSSAAEDPLLGPSCFFTDGLLKMGDGRCGAWARFFRDTLLIHGIKDGEYYAVYAPNIDSVQYESDMKKTFLSGNNPREVGGICVFFVKNWRFSLFDRFFCEDLAGVRGQGNANPPGLFADHAMVKIKGQVYDPSYGGNYASLSEWEDASLDGYGVNFYQGPVRKNETLYRERYEINGVVDVDDKAKEPYYKDVK